MPGEVLVVRIVVILQLVLELFTIASGSFGWCHNDESFSVICIDATPWKKVEVAFAVVAFLACLLGLAATLCSDKHAKPLFMFDAVLNIIAAIGAVASGGMTARDAVRNLSPIYHSWFVYMQLFAAANIFLAFANAGVRLFRAVYAVLCARRGVGGSLTMRTLIPLAIMQLIYDSMILIADALSSYANTVEQSYYTSIDNVDDLALSSSVFGVVAVVVFLLCYRYAQGRKCLVPDPLLTFVAFVLIVAALGVLNSYLAADTSDPYLRKLAQFSMTLTGLFWAGRICFYFVRFAALVFLGWALRASPLQREGAPLLR